MNTRPDRVARDISRTDLALPSGFGWKLMVECLGCGVLVAIGFLWGPLTIVAIGLDGNAPWFWPTIGAGAVAVALLLFVYVRRDVKEVIAEIDGS